MILERPRDFPGEVPGKLSLSPQSGWYYQHHTCVGRVGSGHGKRDEVWREGQGGRRAPLQNFRPGNDMGGRRRRSRVQSPDALQGLREHGHVIVRVHPRHSVHQGAEFAHQRLVCCRVHRRGHRPELIV